MKAFVLRKILLVANLLLLALFYSLLWKVYLQPKQSVHIQLITPKDLKMKSKNLPQRERLDTYQVIYLAFGIPKKPVSAPARRPVKRVMPPPPLRVKVVIYNEESPELSRIWIDEGGQIKIVAVGGTYRGFRISQIERHPKGRKGYKQEIEYRITLERDGVTKDIPFITWEPVE